MNLDLETSNVTEIYRSFNEKNYEKLKLVERDYVGYNTSPEDWLDRMD